MTTAAPAAQTQLIPLAMLFPSPNNPRKFFDQDRLKELAESLASPLGQQVPVLVRPVLDSYEILDGERRFRAAMLGGLKDLECKVVNVDDARALEITVIANLQRQDITPLEEANGVASLLAAGRPVEDIAKDLGKSSAWVYLRAKLIDLAPAWRKAVDEPNSGVYHWSASLLELIARFPLEQQKSMLQDWHVTEVESAKQLHDVIDRQYMRTLKSAPWALDDIKLVPKAGSCSACPKRTSCQQQIFTEVKDDRCLDEKCWENKSEVHTVRAVDAARKEEPKAKLIYESCHRSDVPNKYRNNCQNSFEFDVVKEGTKGATPAVFVAGSKAGKLVHIKMKAEYAGPNGERSREKSEPVTVSKKERLAQFMKRRARGQVAAVITKLGGDPSRSPYQVRYHKPKAASADVEQPSPLLLLSLALSHGLTNDAQTRDWQAYRRISSLGLDGVHAAMWDDMRWRLCSVLSFDAAHSGSADGAELVAKACGINWRAIVAVVQDKMPLPKTLAEHFQEDGSPRTGVTAKAKGKPGKPKKKAGAA